MSSSFSAAVGSRDQTPLTEMNASPKKPATSRKPETTTTTTAMTIAFFEDMLLAAHAHALHLTVGAADEDVHRPAAHRTVLNVFLLGPRRRVDVQDHRLSAARTVDHDLFD